jgi:hypothetical protein
MSTSFRADASVINATAGTSVTVTKPAGTTTDDLLIAVIAAASQTTITPPAGWELIDSEDAGANLRSWIYWRAAGGSEGANYTWTIGASARNYGWIGCYDGFDATTPIFDFAPAAYTSGTAFAYADVDLAPEGHIVSAAVALRTASGSATTWSAAGGTERDDSSTNAGAGLDISGAVWDDDVTDINTYTASQSQTQVVVWSIALHPYWEPYDGGHVPRLARMAFGADPDGDPAGWSWTDVSNDVYEDPGITITAGRRTAHGQADPARVSLVLANPNGDYTPFLATGANYPHIRRGVPLQILIDDIGVNPPYEIVTVFVDSWTPAWDASGNVAVVEVEAVGRLSRISQQASRVASPVRFATEALSPVGYWPLEDASGATQLAEVIAGTPGTLAGVTPAGDSTLPGADSLLVLSASSTPGTIEGRVPTYATTTEWAWTWMLRIPQAVLSTTTLLEWTCGGSAIRWRLTLGVGSPDVLTLEAYNAAGTQLLTSNTLLFDEAEYGSWLQWTVTAKQNGADVDWSYDWSDGGSGSGKFGTVTSQTISNLTTWKVPPSSNLLDAGMGHLAAFNDADVNEGSIGIMMDGQVGESAPDRFGRLLTEAGIQFEYELIDDPDALVWQTMGAQSRSTLHELLREVNDVEQGLMHDAGSNGAVKLHLRETRHNAAVAMALDCLADEVSPGFGPVYDAQQMANDVTAARTGGSSYRARDTDHIAVEGLYDESVTVNVESDVQLPHQAGWRVHLGTVAEMRVPRLVVNFRSAPHLTEAWIRGGLNTRTTVDNLPAQFPQQFADLFIEGFTMRLSTVDWLLEADCSPASPYTVGVLDSDSLGKLDTAGSELASSATSSATSLSVATTSGPLWTTDAGEVPFDIRCGGERMTVTAISGGASPQTFTVTRSVNGVVKAHDAGTALSLWTPLVLAL